MDIGSSSVKIALFDLNGKVIHFKEKAYKSLPEQDPYIWWKSIKDIINDFKKHKEFNEIGAIGVTGQTRGQIFLDKKGNPLRKAILWLDKRATKEAKELNNLIPSKKRKSIWGYVPKIDPSFPLSRLVWIKRNEPDILKKTYKVLQPKDFINYMLTNRWGTDLEGGLGWFNIKEKKVNLDFLKELNIPHDIIQAPYSFTDILGEITDKVEKELGIKKSTPVVVSTMDGFCNLIGSGIITPKIAMDICGTSEIVGFLAENESNKYNGITVLPFMDYYFYGGPTQSGGASLTWFLEKILYLNTKTIDIEKEISKIKKILPDNNKIIFLPYIDGERTPLWDTKAKGAFLGIKKDHTYLHLLKAVLEGVAFSIADIIFKAEKLAKVKVNEVRVSGGGSKSDIWNQIKADVLNIPVSRIKITETALLGSAILAAVGVKFFKSIKEAKDSMVKIDHRYQPNQENHLSYSRIFKLYKKSYISLKDIFHELDQKGVNGE